MIAAINTRFSILWQSHESVHNRVTGPIYHIRPPVPEPSFVIGPLPLKSHPFAERRAFAAAYYKHGALVELPERLPVSVRNDPVQQGQDKQVAILSYLNHDFTHHPSAENTS